MNLNGTNLIEASAGTGKTHTLTQLYLRLITEKHLDISQILVVTFTDMANAELKIRIRKALKDQIINYQKLIHSSDPSHHKIQQNLIDNLYTFDQAAIYTIHAFCKKILQESAFECRQFFNPTFIKNQSFLLKEMVNDFWSNHFYQKDPRFISFVKINGISPNSLINLAKIKLTSPYVKIIPNIDKPMIEITNQCLMALEKLQLKFQQLRYLWQSFGKNIQNIILNAVDNKILNKTIYKNSSIQKLINELNYFFISEEFLWDFLPKKFENFCAKKLISSARKGMIDEMQVLLEQHQYFNEFQSFWDEYQITHKHFIKYLLSFKNEWLEYVESEIILRKQHLNVLSFNDLLSSLHTALYSEQDSLLLKKIRQKFKAILIDEFQDTDPIQYQIFHKIYHGTKIPVFLIGDPKQAIYSFRGADLFAYINAAKSIPLSHLHTMEINWRSDPDYIQVINTIFNIKSPFLREDIQYHQLKHYPEAKNAFKSQQLHSGAFQFLMFDQSNTPEEAYKNDTVSKKWMTENIPNLIAHNVASLLQSDVTLLRKLIKPDGIRILETPIRPDDIAILVRKNEQAYSLQTALRKIGIPSIIYSNLNLFETVEANEISIIIQSIAFYHNRKLISNALATEIIGVNPEQLIAAQDNEEIWNNWLEKFSHYYYLITQKSFTSMFNQLIEDWQVRSRLLQYHDGERRITNLLHLAELIQTVMDQESFDLFRLIRWLEQQKSESENELRLETDHTAVKILTIHKSKGLEFPIIYCPFLWDTKKTSSKKEVLFHDINDQNQYKLDLGSNFIEDHHKLADQEQFTEEIRLAYVALTRAKHRCYLVWGNIEKSENSVLGHLLQTNSVEGLQKRFNAILPSVGIEFLKTTNNNTLIYHPDYPKFTELNCQIMQRKISSAPKNNSYSSLIEGHEQIPGFEFENQIFEKNSILSDFNDQKSLNTKILLENFPKGAKTGLFFHHLFEEIDFQTVDEEERLIFIKTQLAKYSFNEEEFSVNVLQTIKQTLAALLEDPYLKESFALQQISCQNRINEMDFLIPAGRLNNLDAQFLSQIFRHNKIPELHGYADQISKLNFLPIQGFLKGYIDLIFTWKERWYIIDYKTNYLGSYYEDYDLPSLFKTMGEHHYYLQYYFYTLALHRYLEYSLDEYDYHRHFGGVFYLFIRGINPALKTGIYYDRPPENVIKQFSKIIQ